MNTERLCDWWLEDRSKCPRIGSQLITDLDGAPLAFCRTHRVLAQLQYRLPTRSRIGPCPCICNAGGFCGGCGHAGCGARR